MCDPFAVPAGIVTDTDAEPLLGIELGVLEPVSTVPLFGLSRRKLIVWPVENWLAVPFSVAGRLVTVAGLKLSDGAPTVTVTLLSLSVPRQLLRAAVTE